MRSLPATPPASDAATRRAMQGNRRSDTAPEVGLRQMLHAAGFRFRKDFRIRVDGGQTRADIVFTRRRVAVFVDGCFWHGCPQHCRMPTRNRSYWEAKIGRNRERDAAISAALIQGGWTVVRVWEHEPVKEAAARIGAALSAR
jgi:DNA mismatch endonuclease, patch repair protein